MKIGTMVGIAAGIIAMGGGVLTAHSQGYFFVTANALQASQDIQDKLFILSQIRTINQQIVSVEYDLQIDPRNKDWLEELSELSLERSLLRDKLKLILERK